MPRRGSPGTSKHQPLFHHRQFTQTLDILHQQCRCVGAHFAEWGGFSRPALVKKNDAVIGGIEQASMLGRQAAAGAAMQEQDRHAIRIAAFLPVHRVDVVKLQQAVLVRLDGREKARTVKGGHGYRKNQWW
jgi:hypothetical protein